MKLILILLLIIIFVSGCTEYSEGTYEVHPCDQPYTLDLSCDLAEVCDNNVGKTYYENKCN